MYPVWRGHGRFDFLSINNKLFIELILQLEKYQKGKDDLEIYIAKTFDFYSENEYVSTKIDKRDKRILDISKEYIGKKVLDVGCGKGKYVKYLRNMKIEAYGIDPSIEYVKKANTKFVGKGSIYDIRFEKGKFDSVLLIEVLQHVANFEKAFKEIKKVLRKNGHFIVLERNKISISQILKPFQEQLNLWMYPKDSPFKEISLYKSEWVKEFSKYGRIKLIQKISGDGIKAKYIDMYYLFIVEINK